VNPLAVAIMQPYFVPYAGYFRLFAATDLFVIYDCVQFPRRGWVHRNRLVDASGKDRWLTLPLAKAPQQTLIRDLRFAPDAADTFPNRLRSFADLARAPRSASPIMDALHDVSGTPVTYIERLLNRVVTYLDFPWNVVRSSSLGVPKSFRGQDRIIEIVRRVGGREYVNPPGGRHLYDRDTFAQAGIELRFLSEYAGPSASILARILAEEPYDLTKDIRASAQNRAPGPAPGLNSAP
jgi:WbqC-like protein family